MTKYCEFCGGSNGVKVLRGVSRREYFMCIACVKRDEIARLSRELNDIFENVPGAIVENESRKAVEFNFRTGRTRPRFLNAEDLR